MSHNAMRTQTGGQKEKGKTLNQSSDCCSLCETITLEYNIIYNELIY